MVVLGGAGGECWWSTVVLVVRVVPVVMAVVAPVMVVLVAPVVRVVWW